MGENCGNWIPHMQFGRQSPNLCSFGAPLDVGKQNDISAVMNPGINIASRNETMPAYASSALPHLQFGQSIEPHGWFYGLPRFRQEFIPSPNFIAEEKHLADHVKGFKGKIAPYGESGSPRKQFLVIDQTGGQTTVICGPNFGSPDQCLASLHSKLHGANYLNRDEPSFKRDLNHLPMPILDDKFDENHGTATESEMHEDTEEINALLYSDSGSYSSEDDDDDEVTSTGHSPSTMTTHVHQETFRGTAEEVASSAGETKKRKLWDGYDNNIQLKDTASSLKFNKSSGVEDDAESRCSGGNSERSGSLSANKKMRKEKIRDVLRVLQSLIPGGEDKDPVMLLDDAIHCLKSMKLKAKELGLEAL